MDSCSHNHPQIIHDEPSCPLCDMRDEYAKLLKEIGEGLDRIIDSKDESKSEAA